MSMINFVTLPSIKAVRIMHGIKEYNSALDEKIHTITMKKLYG